MFIVFQKVCEHTDRQTHKMITIPFRLRFTARVIIITAQRYIVGSLSLLLCHCISMPLDSWSLCHCINATDLSSVFPLMH